MSQHNRKDPRAKVLSMTVRYRSATLNEFIEHHSYDVSRGGLFIKTPTPFAPGTLLKFEVKIAEDQRVMQGVGRVVWKRDTSTGPEEPGGMGIKFIKLDDASKAVIERLVQSRGQHTVSAFDRSPDSRSVQMFPGAEESTISEDPTVVRSRSDVFPAEIVKASPEGSGVTASIPAPQSGAALPSIPVPSGPALSVASGGVSLPPMSLSPNSGAPSASSLNALGSSHGASNAPGARVSASPRAVGSASPSLVPRPPSAKPGAEGPYRKPGPVPVNSAPPPRSSSAYVLLGLVAVLVGGGFLYLKLTHQSLGAEGASRPKPAPTAPPSAPAAPSVALPAELPIAPTPSDPRPAEPAPNEPTEAASATPTDGARGTSTAEPAPANPDLGAPGAAVAEPAPKAAPPPVAKASARKAKPRASSSAGVPSDKEGAASAGVNEPEPKPSEPSEPKVTAPAEAPPAEAPPTPGGDEEFR